MMISAILMSWSIRSDLVPTNTNSDSGSRAQTPRIHRYGQCWVKREDVVKEIAFTQDDSQRQWKLESHSIRELELSLDGTINSGVKPLLELIDRQLPASHYLLMASDSVLAFAKALGDPQITLSKTLHQLELRFDTEGFTLTDEMTLAFLSMLENNRHLRYFVFTMPSDVDDRYVSEFEEFDDGYIDLVQQ
ncbi:hypothetical protein Poli38472_013716 [Pythium oligandrum]|uniref:Uncharacterized protein n=1 Tax=Pythium oligandrum TaxID=41045 RepID=A0A8K1CEU4_PYTOL|nr:hypothetical protein Poli38472_013716 [Pythium oligandrum]|eukprot:TMW61253.1 hypothetical protein Poli38472_013716 [Pythium oligandrum]